MIYRATQDYALHPWQDVEAATMDEAADKMVEKLDLQPGDVLWISVFDRDGRGIAEMRGYEAYRPKRCKARAMLPPIE